MNNTPFHPKHCKAYPLYAAILLGLCQQGTVTAAEEIKEASPLIVTATRLESDTERLPANVTIITAEQIQNSAAKTLPEILSLEAGVNSRSLYGNNAARSTIDMRGFGAAAKQNTLILLDGRRLNDVDLSAVDFAAIPLGNIERIEIIRGGSVLYGDGASGGAINIITRRGNKRKQLNEAKLTLGSYNSHQLEGIFQNTTGPLMVNISASALESEGYREHNDIRQQNLQGDISLQQETGELFVKFGLDNQELELPAHRTVDPTIPLDQLNNSRKGTGTPNDYADQKGYFVTAGTSQFIGDNTELIIDAGYRHKDQQAFFDDYAGCCGHPPGTFASYVDTDLNTWSLTPRLKMEYGDDISHTITTGIDLYDSDYRSYRAQNAAVSYKHRYDANQRNIAAYLHNLAQVNDSTQITAGMRIERVKFEATDLYDATAPGQPFGGAQASPINTSDNEHMLEFGIRHQISKDIALFGKLERSVRIGTLDEILDTGNNSFSPLKPQSATHIDAGINLKQGSRELMASIYHMQLRNEIHYDIGSFSNINLDPTKRYGLELTASNDINNNLNIRFNYAYTRAKFREGSYTGNDVPLVPMHTAGVTALWKVSSDINGSASVNYVGKKYFDNDQQNSAAKIPAYTMVDLKLNKQWQEWKLEGAVHNVLDKKAFDYGVKSTATAGRYNAYPLPERNFSISISRKFQ